MVQCWLNFAYCSFCDVEALLAVITLVDAIQEGDNLKDIEKKLGELNKRGLRGGPTHDLVDFSSEEGSFHITLNLDESSNLTNKPMVWWVSSKDNVAIPVPLLNSDR